MEMLRIDPWLLGEKQLYPKFVFKVLEKKLKKNRSSQKNLDQGFLPNEIGFDVQPFFCFNTWIVLLLLLQRDLKKLQTNSFSVLFSKNDFINQSNFKIHSSKTPGLISFCRNEVIKRQKPVFSDSGPVFFLG